MLLAILGSVTKVLAYTLLPLLGLWCWFQWKHRRLIRAASKLYTSNLKALPIIGHAHYMISDWSKVTDRIMSAIEDTVSNGFDMVCLWCGPLPLIVAVGVDDIQKILNSSITSEKSDDYAMTHYCFGNGLIVAPKSIWRITRRHINPLFHPRNLEHLMPTFNRNSRELVLKLSEHVDGGAFNVMEYTMETALKTICNLIFGADVKFNMESQEFRGLLYVVERVADLIMKRIINPWLRIDIIFEFFYKKELDNIGALLESFTGNPLKEAKKINSEKKEIKPVLGTEEGMVYLLEGPLNLLQVYKILQDKFPSFTEKDLKQEMVTLYATGTDTVGATVSTTLLAIAQHQDIQEQLYKEISSVLAEDNDVTTQDLVKMPYLDQVYRETLRWSTMVPFIGRKASEDIKLSSCTVPAGSTVLMSLAGVHLNPKNYPNPRHFNPERFSQENTRGKDHSTFLAFSGGPRNCIGISYAQLVVKVMLVHILREYKVSTTMDMYTMKRRLVTTLIASDGYYIQLEKRNREKKM